MTTDRYIIRIKSLNVCRDESGFLGNGDDFHAVRSAVDARRFLTIEAAQAEIDRLKVMPMHFLAVSRNYMAYVVMG